MDSSNKSVNESALVYQIIELLLRHGLGAVDQSKRTVHMRRMHLMHHLEGDAARAAESKAVCVMCIGLCTLGRLKFDVGAASVFAALFVGDEQD